ncbi:hypothetical protein HK100_004513, partial [Physocladia obscura]
MVSSSSLSLDFSDVDQASFFKNVQVIQSSLIQSDILNCSFTSFDNNLNKNSNNKCVIASNGCLISKDQYMPYEFLLECSPAQLPIRREYLSLVSVLPTSSSQKTPQTPLSTTSRLSSPTATTDWLISALLPEFSKPLPPEKPKHVCANCQGTETSVWRKDSNRNTLCNACGLFRKQHGYN